MKDMRLKIEIAQRPLGDLCSIHSTYRVCLTKRLKPAAHSRLLLPSVPSQGWL